MGILFTGEIKDAVINELRGATGSVQVITAYCKEKSFVYLNEAISSSVKEKKLLIRFRMEDILMGSTDFDVLQEALDNGWNVYIRFDLHAKTYIVDNKRCLVGSANATSSGLNLGRSGNIEMAAFVDIEQADTAKINKLFDDAIRIDHSIIDIMKFQIDQVAENKKFETQSWDSSILSLFQPNIETLFSYELPEKFDLVTGTYFPFLDFYFDGNVDELKTALRWSNSFQWLLHYLKKNNGCSYFGELSAGLHSALISDPKPYRKEIKEMLESLLKLIEITKMEEIIIDRPNYSQRIRLV